MRVALLALVVLLATAAGLGLHDSGPVRWLEQRSLDARFAIRGERPPDPRLVLVAIDDSSLARLPRYPFSRTRHAQALDRLHKAGARLIVYDVAFDRPTTDKADFALYEAAERARPVVFATSLVRADGHTQVLGGDENLRAIGAAAAAAQLPFDSDGTLRRPLASYKRLPTIATRVSGHAPPASAWIDFPRPLKPISFADVLDGKFDASAVRGKIVIVGATAEVLHDSYSTPAADAVPGAEIQAAAIATALNGYPLRSAAPALRIVLTLVLALLVPLVAYWRGPLASAAVAAAALVLWLVAAQVAFDHADVLDVVAPTVALIVGAVGAVTLSAIAAERERRRLRAMFATLSSTQFVEQVLRGEGPPGITASSIVPGFRLEEIVGHGGMGVVYRATQLALKRPVAIKLIAATHEGDPDFRARFRRESLLAAAVDHPNVIPVYEAGEADGVLYIAMRLVDGEDLAAHVRRHGPLEPTRALALVSQIAGALDAAHALGLVHRDVKPANVLLTFGGHAYLTDFGLAREVGADAGLTRTGQVVGSLDYLPPEQALGEGIDARADVYALAAVLFFCLTGRAPYGQESQAARLVAIVNAPPPRAGVDPVLDDAIACAMAKDPLARPASAGEFIVLAGGVVVPVLERVDAVRPEEGDATAVST